MGNGTPSLTEKGQLIQRLNFNFRQNQKGGGEEFLSGRIFFYRRERGEEKIFFLGRGFFYRRERGEEKIFFLGRGFFYREAVSQIFSGGQGFFLQGGWKGLKVVFA